MLAVVRIRLFGGLDVDGIPAHDIGSRKARTLLKALAVARGHRVTIDALTEILWPGALPAHPVEQVQVLVSRLRATLGSECITRTDAGYALHYAWLDVDELEARTTEAANRLAAGGITGARAAAAAAVHLAAGRFLPDEDGEWAEQARRVVERTVARARLIGAEAALSAGDAAGGAELAAAALDHDPYDERALRAVMAAHAHAGRPASALAVYASCRERLAEDLGVSPTAETEHLHAAILRDEWVPGEIPPPSEQAGAGRSPTGAAPFAGRAAVLAALDGELA
ncbi:MAG TPA: BTAD domain-containing putative transcriptional regulator, partial [Acidimicrobiales bacterium]|nr:BTAD domain-containing putative transcriptional regulator [Acidimicrobiales bacterium]